MYSHAVKQNNPELTKAKELGIPLLTRAEFLGQIMLNYPMAIGSVFTGLCNHFV